MSRSRFELNPPLPSKEGSQEVARLEAQHVARNAAWRQEEAVKARCELHPDEHNDAIGDAVSRDSERLRAEHEARHPNCAAGCSLQGWVDMPDCPVCAEAKGEAYQRQNDQARAELDRFIANKAAIMNTLRFFLPALEAQAAMMQRELAPGETSGRAVAMVIDAENRAAGVRNLIKTVEGR